MLLERVIWLGAGTVNAEMRLLSLTVAPDGHLIKTKCRPVSQSRHFGGQILSSLHQVSACARAYMYYTCGGGDNLVEEEAAREAFEKFTTFGWLRSA